MPSTASNANAHATASGFGTEIRVTVVSNNDLVGARHHGRLMANRVGLSSRQATLVATAISELARNIVCHAGCGEIVVRRATDRTRGGITVIARDQGPGIADIGLAMQEGYSTSGGLGLGLPGVCRIMDEFRVDSEPGRGTTVTAIKWTP